MASSSMGVAMYPADEGGCRVKLRDWETLCFTEYVSDCSVPLPCRLDRRRLYSNSNFGVRDSEWSADRNLPLLSVQAHVSVMVIFLQSACSDQECCYQQRYQACSEACEWFPHFSRGGEAMRLRFPTNFSETGVSAAGPSSPTNY